MRKIWYTSLPAPIPPWIVKQYKGMMTEQELLRRLNEGSMECRLDPLLGDMRYSEPHPEDCWDLWINDGTTLRDRYHREGLRERAKEEVLARRAKEWGVGAGGLWGGIWGLLKLVTFLMMLPFEIIGLRTTTQWFLGTGEYSSRDDYLS